MADEILRDEPAPESEQFDAAENRRQASEMELEEREALVEALIFAHGEPISRELLSEITGLGMDEVAQLLEAIRNRYAETGSGVEVAEVGGRLQFRTRQRFAPFLRQLRAQRPRRLTPAALETLAIVAYRQPIVKSDIEKLRGVDATPTLKTLLERGLIRIVGHQSSVGSPALYGTTEEFLKIFGLNALSDLPTLRDLKDLDDPGEIEESAQEGVEAPA